MTLSINLLKNQGLPCLKTQKMLKSVPDKRIWWKPSQFQASLTLPSKISIECHFWSKQDVGTKRQYRGTYYIIHSHKEFYLETSIFVNSWISQRKCLLSIGLVLHISCIMKVYDWSKSYTVTSLELTGTWIPLIASQLEFEDNNRVPVSSDPPLIVVW